MRVSRRACVVLLVLGAALRLATVSWPGTGDVMVWKIWAHAASRDGVVQMYGVGGTPTERRLHAYDGRFATVDYPPAALLLLSAVGRAYGAAVPGFPNTPALTAAVKTLPFAADIGITVLLWWLVRRTVPDEPHLARAAALGYWLNPGAWLNGAVLGYLDPLAGLAVVGAFAAVARRRPGLAGAITALALLIKPQAAIVGPAVALGVWAMAAEGGRCRAFARAAAGGTAVLAAGVLPYVFAGAWPNLVQAMASLGRHNTLSANAANPWWIVTYLMRAAYAVTDLGWHDAFLAPVRRPLMITTIVDLGYPNPRGLANLAALGAIAWGVWRARGVRAIASVAAVGAWCVIAYFMLAIAVHENHAYLALPLVVLAAALDRRWRSLAVVVSLSIALNLNLFYGFGEGMGFAVPRGLLPPDLSVWLAAVNVAASVAFARRLAGLRDERLSPVASSG